MDQITLYTHALPPKSAGYPGRPRSPHSIALQEMQIGQCFYLPKSKYKGLSSMVSQYAKGTHKKFTTRRLIQEDGTPVVGCWRIA